MNNELDLLGEVAYGRHRIVYEVKFSKRKTLGIHVHPDQRVEVHAPEGTTSEAVRAKVQQRSRWILKQQRFFETFAQVSPPKEYVGGETHRYLGRQYRLKIFPLADGQREGVKLIGRYFRVYTSEPENPDRTRRLLEQWFRAKAKQRLTERFEEGCRVMRRYGIERPELVIRSMKTRWGSYTPSSRVLLNSRLIHAPAACIDYVVIHELCHLKHPHHGRAFYDLLDLVLPDWRRLKDRLEQMAF